jgi:hypothetical protein
LPRSLSMSSEYVFVYISSMYLKLATGLIKQAWNFKSSLIVFELDRV